MICKKYIIWQRGFRLHSTHPTKVRASRGRAIVAARVGQQCFWASADKEAGMG